METVWNINRGGCSRGCHSISGADSYLFGYLYSAGRYLQDFTAGIFIVSPWEFPIIILRTLYHERTFYMEGFLENWASRM